MVRPFTIALLLLLSPASRAQDAGAAPADGGADGGTSCASGGTRTLASCGGDSCGCSAACTRAADCESGCCTAGNYCAPACVCSANGRLFLNCDTSGAGFGPQPSRSCAAVPGQAPGPWGLWVLLLVLSPLAVRRIFVDRC